MNRSMFSTLAAYLPFLRYLPLEAVRRQQKAREDLQVLDEMISAAREREIDDVRHGVGRFVVVRQLNRAAGHAAKPVGVPGNGIGQR